MAHTAYRCAASPRAVEYAGERKRSRYARSGIQSFAPDLVLQGIVVTEREEAFDPHVLMQSAHASTVIDLKRRTVSQTHQENVYHVRPPSQALPLKVLVRLKTRSTSALRPCCPLALPGYR